MHHRSFISLVFLLILLTVPSGNNIANPMAQSADGRYLYFDTFGTGVFRRTTYIPETTTTTTTTETPTPGPTDPTVSDSPFPLEVIALTLGVATAAVIIVLVVWRMKRKP